MSVVVNMPMPSECPTCQMSAVKGDTFGDYYLCCGAMHVKKITVEHGKNKPDWCPIICSLPENHGRLIDASTVIGEVDAGYTDDYGNPIPVNRPVSVDEYLGLEVPTIVPAERKKT